MLQDPTHQKDHSDPETMIWNACNDTKHKYSTLEKKKFISSVVPKIIIEDNDLSSSSLDHVVNSFRLNHLANLGLAYKKETYDFNNNERDLLISLASDVCDVRFLAENNWQSYNHYNSLEITKQSLNGISKALKIKDNVNEILSIYKVPSFKAFYFENSIDFYSVLKLRKETESIEFRKWINSISTTTDTSKIGSEYINYIADKKGFFEGNMGKYSKELILMTAGAGISTFITDHISISNASIGYAAAKVVDFGSNVFNGYIFDKLASGWHPKMYIENILKTRDI